MLPQTRWWIKEVEEGVVLYCLGYGPNGAPGLVLLLLLYRFDGDVLAFLPVYCATLRRQNERINLGYNHRCTVHAESADAVYK